MTSPTHMRAFRLEIAVCLLVVAGAAVLYGPGLLGHALAVRDMPGVTLPSRAFFRDSLLRGDLPVWNPLVGLGIPTLAVPVHGSLYPGQLMLLLGSLPTGVAITWALHTAWAGLGAYALARACGCSPASAALPALVASLGGYATSVVWNGEKSLVYAWLPWMAFTIRRAVAAPSPGRVLVAAVTSAVTSFAGDPFLMFDGSLLALPFAIDAAASRGEPLLAQSRRLSLGLAVPLAVAVVLAAPVLLPALLLRPETLPAIVPSLATTDGWSLHPVRWLELFVPTPFGDPFTSASEYAGAAFSRFRPQPWAVSLYVGAATAAFAASARSRLAACLAGTGVVAILLALGPHLPVLAVVRTLVPPLAFARFPEKHVAVACDAVAFLGALGLERLLATPPPSRARALLVTGVVAAGGLAAAILFAPAPLRESVRVGAVRAVVVIVATLGVLGAAQRWKQLLILLPAVTAIDLFACSQALLRWSRDVGFPRPPLSEVRPAPDAAPVRLLRPSLGHVADMATLPDNAAAIFGLQVLPGVDFARTPALVLDDGPRTLEILRVDALVSARAGAGEPVDQPGAWELVRLSHWPRAWLVAHAEAADDRRAGLLLAGPAWDLEGAATIAARGPPPALARLRASPPGAAGSCRVDRYANTAVDVLCSASQPGLLVLAEAFSPGWTVTVDGQEAELVRTDIIYRGVALDRGEHRVRFSYDPPGLVVGLLVSTLAALVGLLLVVRRRTDAHAYERAETD